MTQVLAFPRNVAFPRHVKFPQDVGFPRKESAFTHNVHGRGSYGYISGNKPTEILLVK